MPIVPLLGSKSNLWGVPPEHPELCVKDSQTALNIPVTGLSGWDESYVQAQSLTFSPLTFELAGEGLAALANSEVIWAERKSKILVAMLASDAAAVVTIAMAYEDSDGLWTYTATQAITATALQVDSKYVLPLAVFDALGAKRAKIYIVSISVGTVDVQLATV